MNLNNWHIKDINIAKYYELENVSLSNLSPSFNLIIGKNEAGKSTILDFIRGVLTGYERRRPNSWGGRLYVIHRSLGDIIIERMGGGKGGKLKILRTSGESKGLEHNALTLITGGIGRVFFENCIAFSLNELQNYASFTQKEVHDALFAVSGGLDPQRLKNARSVIEKGADALFRPRGKKPVINQLIATLKAVERHIRDKKEEAEGSLALTTRLKELHSSIEDIKDRQKVLMVTLQRLEDILSLWDKWLLYKELKAGLNSVLDNKAWILNIEDDIERRYEISSSKIEELSKMKKALKDEVAGLERELENIDNSLVIFTSSDDSPPPVLIALLRLIKESQAVKDTLYDHDKASQLLLEGILEMEISIKKGIKEKKALKDELLSTDKAYSEIKTEIERLIMAKKSLEAEKSEIERKISLFNKAQYEQNAQEKRLINIGAIAGALSVLTSITGYYMNFDNMLSNAFYALLILFVLALTIYLIRGYMRFKGSEGNNNITTDNMTIEGLNKRLLYVSNKITANDLKINEHKQKSKDIHKKIGEIKDKLNALEAKDDDITYKLRQMAILCKCDETSSKDSLSLSLLGIIKERISQEGKRLSIKHEILQKLTAKKGAILDISQRIEGHKKEKEGLLKALCVDNDEEFFSIIEKKQMAEKLSKDISALSSSLSLIGDDFERQLTVYSKDELLIQFTDIKEKIKKINKQHDALLKEEGGVREKFNKLIDEDGLHALMIERERLINDLRESIRRWAVFKTASFILNDAKKQYELMSQPIVIREGKNIFERLTQSRYRDIYYDIENMVIKAVDKANKIKEAEELSRGAREQLFLALRLGYLKATFPYLPIIMDDILVNFDNYRLKAAVNALLEISQKRQIIFFSCHEEYKDIFLSEGDANEICCKIL